MSAYTLGDAARICHVPRGRLRYWERTALLRLSSPTNQPAAFRFEDLISVRSVVRLLGRGVPLRRIRRSMEAVRLRIPELDRPLGALRTWGEGSRRLVVRHDGVLVQPDGQLVLDFSMPPAPAGDVARLVAREEPVADGMDWFERGCRLDTDRATWPDAIEAYRRAIELAPDFADAHCNLGALYFNQDRRARARRCFERALELDPSHVEANLNLAALLEEAGRGEAALGHYKSALARDPFNGDTLVSLALLYERLALPRKALDPWRRYLQLDPLGSWADLARRRLEEGA